MAAQSRPQVLVIDDDPAIMQLFRALLGRAGFEIDTASDGTRAWHLIETNGYQVIIMDLMMPHLSGFELLDRIAVQKPALLSRIIVATGASKRQLGSFDATRVHSLIRKPFDIDELMSAASQCAQSARDSCYH
jgi:CheY-like chemotaxis protein